MIDALPLGEIGGQHAPLDPAFVHIKDGIEHGPHTEGTRPSTAFVGRDHIFHPVLLPVGQVAWICFFVHISMLHSPRRLFRQALKVCQRGAWQDRMLVETVLSMLTLVCHLKKVMHRGWAYFQARLAFTMAAFN